MILSIEVSSAAPPAFPGHSCICKHNYYAFCALLQAHLAALLLVLGGLISSCGALRLAAIGDYGWAGSAEAGVAAMIGKWGVDDVLALGDNNYVSILAAQHSIPAQ